MVNKKLPFFKEIKEGDVFLQDSRKTDIIIAVMGPTGAGKSSIINAILGRTQMEVGHKLQSCTQHIQYEFIQLPSLGDRRIVLVDTPGFDDTYIEDSEILRRLAVWLAKSYHDHVLLSGLIYVHDITQVRMGTARKNLEVFHKLCGTKLERVLLVTTKWDRVSEETGTAREQQLYQQYWKDMIGQGARTSRSVLDPAQRGATLLKLILERVTSDSVELPLRMQQEMVDLARIIPETEAGKALRFSLKDLLKIQKAIEKQLRNSQKSDESADFQERMKANQLEIKKILKQIQDLRVPIGRSILSFFGL